MSIVRVAFLVVIAVALVAAQENQLINCTYNGKIYRAPVNGEVQVDACTYCTCLSTGEMDCSSISCKHACAKEEYEYLKDCCKLCSKKH
ncbi:cysteine-rich motor neuron 1 protein-like [Biomphalaria glabrata]|uniref:Cysteine-rich motor neuron 1 protein-like n=1 Tax=Biomphalaria glabrata TaxID=6526 RepID=A0A9W3A2Z0_BIOGL|nr:cysteine-rich motor neuron 1 protein-like [Biomphalaria glabrata]